MARFDVYIYESDIFPYIVDVQADLLSHLTTNVVIPLAKFEKFKDKTNQQLNPVIVINDQSYLLMTQNIVGFPKHKLKSAVSNVENQYRTSITNALDFLFQGY